MRHPTRQMTIQASLWAAGLGLAAILASPVNAQANNPSGQYQQDVAHCNSTPGIDKAACLKEAGAAEQAARQNTLSSPSVQSEGQNRTDRCALLPADQQQDCMILMDDKNANTEGSVQSGGVLRETTITIPAPAGS